MSFPAICETHLRRGFVEVGYHRVVEYFDRRDDIAPGRYLMLVGRDELARAAGEPLDGMNRRGLHICCVGNYDLSPPPEALWAYLLPRVASLMDLFGLTPDKVIGHREVKGVAEAKPGKKCPGELWDMGAFRSRLGGLL